ncbi:hypothetical protein IFT62_23190 [Pseudomonas lutea]|uniref:IgA-specific serine endopeptidase autotransporter n=1 Tax=Pseudomonas lutea TaxID=243924 RepID=A0ABR9AE91_9PSED|nr:hypothetical protein [Pseudomonas lutea]MBD8124112.1 hypothetical protein [Pseudomonas lutea]
MTHYIVLLQQLPSSIQSEVIAHLGSITGMSDLQVVERYRDAASQLRAAKLASIPPYAPGERDDAGHLTLDQFNNMVGADLSFMSAPLVEVHRQIIASEVVWYLSNFINQLSSTHAQMIEAARQEAQRRAEEAARQLAQQQAEEAARQRARQQAEAAARLHSQRLAEQQARELEQRRANEAAQLAARQLAEQQAEAAAQALISQRAQESALREARLATELVAVTREPVPQARSDAKGEPENDLADSQPLHHLLFVPGPLAMVEVERATVVLKQRIDTAVAEYASAIGPYLTTPSTSASLAT